MSITFQLNTANDKNKKIESYHGAYSSTALVIKGHWNMSGPQTVCEGGVPEWAANVFKAVPHITKIAVSSENSGAVWSRLLTTEEELAAIDEPVVPVPVSMLVKATGEHLKGVPLTKCLLCGHGGVENEWSHNSTCLIKNH